MLSQAVFLQGLGLGASLIMPIGAQNAYVIRTAVRGRHVGLTVAACILVDMALIALGMSGFGLLVESSPRLLLAARWGGAAFLLCGRRGHQSKRERDSQDRAAAEITALRHEFPPPEARPRLARGVVSEPSGTAIFFRISGLR